MKFRKKLTLGLAVLAAVVFGAMWIVGTVDAATIQGQVLSLQSSDPDVTVYLRPVGPSTGNNDRFYTPDPYTSGALGMGYYMFDNVTQGLWIVTAISQTYKFDKPAHSVLVDSSGNITKIDNVSPQSLTVNFTAVTTVNGQCGSSNGQSLTSAPTSGLCTQGSASGVSGSGPWTWSCAGTGDGTTAGCQANLYTVDPVNGQCGSSNGAVLSSAPTSGFCNAGTYSGLSGTGPWTWTCNGQNNGSTASCQASLQGSGPSGATLLPQSGLGMTVTNPVTIAAGGEQHYYFTLSTAAYAFIMPQTTTRDWQQNVDMFISNASQPSCPSTTSLTKWNNIPPSAAPWYNLTSDSNESVYVAGQYAAQSTFYVTICNRSGVTAKYGISWSAR